MKKYIILGIIILAVILGGVFALFPRSTAVRGKVYGGACRKQV